jgi:uncharacterized membrane protein YdfJ with MMPL/SSD domain
MFTRFVELVERRARWVLGAWVLAAVVLTLAAPSLADVGSQDTTDFLPKSAPSQQADQVLAKLVPGDPTRDASIVVVSRAGGLTPDDHAYITDLSTYLSAPAQQHDVKAVQTAATNPDLAPFLRSPDGAAELVIVSMNAAPFSTTGTGAVERLRAKLDASAPPGLSHHVTGVGGLAADQASGVVESFGRTAIVTVLLVLVILLLIYRSAVAALIPLVTIGLAFGVSQGIVSYIAQAGLKVNTLVGTFMVVMVFGAGTDYCLFLTSRYREELAAGDEISTTVVRTTKVIGSVIAASAATVIVGFGSMITADFGIFKTMGPAVGIAIAVTLLAGITLTPALLSLAGSKVFWPRTLQQARTHGEDRSLRWQRVAGLVRSRPAELLLAGIIVLQIPAAGLAWNHASFNLVSDLPTSADARVGYNTVAAHYPGGIISPVYLVLRTNGPILDDARLAAIDHLTDVLRAQPGLAQVRSVTQPAGEPLTLSNIGTLTGGVTDPAALGFDPSTDLTPLVAGLSAPGGLRLTGSLLSHYPQLTQRLGLLLGNDGQSTRLIISLAGNPYDNSALDAFERVDDTTAQALAGTALSGSMISVGGPSSFYADIREISSSDFRLLCAVILGAIFIVLALLLKSLVAPFYLLASVVLSFAATMGITVIVFEGILGQDGITFWLAPFLFVILVALGADYNIFIMSRVREEAEAGYEVHDAVDRGLVLTGRVITSAGFILAGTFAALLLAPLPFLRQIGFGIGVGILIDTFIVRTLIVPSATMLLGRWAFWPIIPGETRATAPIRPRQVGIAVAAVALLAVGLVAIAAGRGTAKPIQIVATASPTTASIGDASAGSINTTSTDPAAPDLPVTTGATDPPATGVSSVVATTPPLGTDTTQPAVPAPTSTVVAPAVGTWMFHVTGTRTIAGSAANIDEQSPTTVSRTGGTDDAPEMRVYSQTSAFTRDDTRRFTATGVDLLATTFSASGATFGGTLSPPQVLAQSPLTLGATWSGHSTAGGLVIDGTGQIIGERDVTTPAGTFHCWDVKFDATISGSVQGEQHDTSCWAPELGMPVESTQQLKGTYSGIPFAVDLHFTLTTMP